MTVFTLDDVDARDLEPIEWPWPLPRQDPPGSLYFWWERQWRRRYRDDAEHVELGVVDIGGEG